MNYKLSSETKIRLKEKNLKVEKAKLTDLDEILKLFSERIKWFKNNNINQWSKYLEHHPKEEFYDTIKNNNYFILKEDNDIIAGFEISTNSKYWEDETTKAYYIYKIVTKVGYKNIGKIIFDICKCIAKTNDIEYLRIDCLKNNEKLNEIYKSHGFKLIKTGNLDYYTYSLRELKINPSKYYRVTYKEEGIYNALKKNVTSDIWKKLLSSKNFNWLPKPPSYADNNKSYFTEKGYEFFKENTLPLMYKYLDKEQFNIEIKLELKDIIYQDDYQVVEK